MPATWMRMRASVLAIGVATLAVATSPASAQSSRKEQRLDVTPYIGIDQTVTGPLKGGGDVLTYTNVTAGITAQVHNRRVEAQADIEYNHSFGWGRQATDQDQLTGILSSQFHVARGLTIAAGGMATRVRTDGIPGPNMRTDGYASQMYAGYIGPSYVTKVGDVDISASYMLGYTRIEDDVSFAVPGQPTGGSFQDSFSHNVTGSIGIAPGVLPIGLVASGGYAREDARQLDQRFEDAWGRLDATLPVSPTLALIGGAGYEKIQISQRSPVLDTQTGAPLIVNGHYVTDQSSPRQLVYDQDGFIWDAGVLWRPSHRTSLEARVGERYGGMTYQGSFIWQGRDASFGLFVFDGIDSFGRVIQSNVAAVRGTDLNVGRNPFSGDLTGCAFSVTGGGACFNDALSGITDANFRYRGVNAQFSARRGPWGWGLGAGYSQRKFITPRGDTVYIRGTRDENWFGNASLTYTVNDSSSIDTVVYANYFNASGGRSDATNYGAFTSYYRGITRRLSASASVGVDGVKQDEIDTIISAMGQVGLRYSF